MLYLTPYRKTNSKWTTALNIRAKTTKLLEENRVNLCDLELDNSFLDITPKAQITKGRKIDKTDFIKILNFCALKDPVKN